jgi:NAD(P)-dependent dehydrogenase (short-subunit alcohol dehydrogenase family)
MNAISRTERQALSPRLLEGQRAIVTGANSGIGEGVARALAEAGARVVVNYVTGPDRAEQVADEIRRAGGEAVASHADVADEIGAQSMVDLALATWGRLDAVVNNAGILRSGLLLRTNADAWRAVFEVHLIGTMLVTQAAARHWRELAKAGGDVDAAVVNTSSTAGLFGFVGEPAYSAAKAGVIGFTSPTGRARHR